MANIKFVQTSRAPQDTKLYVDGVDITSSCRSIKINASANSITTVMLDIFPSELEIECENVKLTTDHFTVQDMLDALTDEMLKDSKINYIRNELGKIKTSKRYRVCTNPYCEELALPLDMHMTTCPFCDFDGVTEIIYKNELVKRLENRFKAKKEGANND